MAPRAILLRTLRARQLEARALPLRFVAPVLPAATSASLRSFSASSRSFNAQNEEAKGEQQKDGKQQQQQERKAPRPDEATGPPQSPFKVFAQVLKEEISKNKAWQENVKTLQGDVDKLADTQAMKRARDMYERARVSERRW
jgi:import inner membrane translocase subunit TIM44